MSDDLSDLIRQKRTRELKSEEEQRRAEASAEKVGERWAASYAALMEAIAMTNQEFEREDEGNRFEYVPEQPLYETVFAQGRLIHTSEALVTSSTNAVVVSQAGTVTVAPERGGRDIVRRFSIGNGDAWEWREVLTEIYRRDERL